MTASKSAVTRRFLHLLDLRVGYVTLIIVAIAVVVPDVEKIWCRIFDDRCINQLRLLLMLLFLCSSLFSFSQIIRQLFSASFTVEIIHCFTICVRNDLAHGNRRGLESEVKHIRTAGRRWDRLQQQTSQRQQTVQSRQKIVDDDEVPLQRLLQR